MSTYESDPAGLGVGKRYGPRGIGGTKGEYIHEGSVREMVFELVAGEPLDAATLTKQLPAGYLIESIRYEVAEAFAATSGFTIAIGGGTASTEDSLATIAAAASYTAGAITNLSSTSAQNLVVTVDAAGLASTTGKATIVVKYVVI